MKINYNFGTVIKSKFNDFSQFLKDLPILLKSVAIVSKLQISLHFLITIRKTKQTKKQKEWRRFGKWLTTNNNKNDKTRLIV